MSENQDLRNHYTVSQDITFCLKLHGGYHLVMESRVFELTVLLVQLIAMESMVEVKNMLTYLSTRETALKENEFLDKDGGSYTAKEINQRLDLVPNSAHPYKYTNLIETTVISKNVSLIRNLCHIEVLQELIVEEDIFDKLYHSKCVFMDQFEAQYLGIDALEPQTGAMLWTCPQIWENSFFRRESNI